MAEPARMWVPTPAEELSFSAGLAFMAQAGSPMPTSIARQFAGGLARFSHENAQVLGTAPASSQPAQVNRIWMNNFINNSPFLCQTQTGLIGLSQRKVERMDPIGTEPFPTTMLCHLVHACARTLEAQPEDVWYLAEREYTVGYHSLPDGTQSRLIVAVDGTEASFPNIQWERVWVVEAVSRAGEIGRPFICFCDSTGRLRSWFPDSYTANTPGFAAFAADSICALDRFRDWFNRQFGPEEPTDDYPSDTSSIDTVRAGVPTRHPVIFADRLVTCPADALVATALPTQATLAFLPASLTSRLLPMPQSRPVRRVRSDDPDRTPSPPPLQFGRNVSPAKQAFIRDYLDLREGPSFDSSVLQSQWESVGFLPPRPNQPLGFIPPPDLVLHQGRSDLEERHPEFNLGFVSLAAERLGSTAIVAATGPDARSSWSSGDAATAYTSPLRNAFAEGSTYSNRNQAEPDVHIHVQTESPLYFSSSGSDTPVGSPVRQTARIGPDPSLAPPAMNGIRPVRPVRELYPFSIHQERLIARTQNRNQPPRHRIRPTQTIDRVQRRIDLVQTVTVQTTSSPLISSASIIPSPSDRSGRRSSVATITADTGTVIPGSEPPVWAAGVGVFDSPSALVRSGFNFDDEDGEYDNDEDYDEDDEGERM